MACGDGSSGCTGLVVLLCAAGVVSATAAVAVA